MTVFSLTTLKAIQNPVQDRLDLVAKEMQELLTAEVPLLAQVGEHLMLMKGKLMRPTFVLLCSEIEKPGEAAAKARAGEVDRAVRLGAVVELIHLGALVHDDSVDQSSLRRGIPTLNVLFNHQVSIIAGDFLYLTALNQLVRNDETEALKILVDASTQMTIGEMWQMSSFAPLESTEKDYERVIRAKTASLIEAACRCGALCGAPHYEEQLRRFGDSIGMAFQIVDDLLDYTEVAATTGKPNGHDLGEKKVTLPLIAALRTMSPSARKRVEELFATEEQLSEPQVSEIIGIVAEAGGLDYARKRGEEFALQAERALVDIPAGPAKDALIGSISYVMERNF